MKNEKLIADTFNKYFADITKTLQLKKHQKFDGQPLSSITEYSKNNASVIKIKEKYGTQKNSFSFTLFSKDKRHKAINLLLLIKHLHLTFLLTHFSPVSHFYTS